MIFTLSEKREYQHCPYDTHLLLTNQYLFEVSPQSHCMWIRQCQNCCTLAELSVSDDCDPRSQRLHVPLHLVDSRCSGHSGAGNCLHAVAGTVDNTALHTHLSYARQNASGHDDIIKGTTDNWESYQGYPSTQKNKHHIVYCGWHVICKNTLSYLYY